MQKLASRFIAICVAFALAGGVAALVGCSDEEEINAETVDTTQTVQTTAGAYQVIDAAAVEALDDSAVLVDVRTPEEYEAGHIPGALNASYPSSSGGPCGADGDAETFRANWAELDIPLDAHVVLYCRTGVRASAAANALIEDGYEDVDVYEGSWTDWTSDASRAIE